MYSYQDNKNGNPSRLKAWLLALVIAIAAAVPAMSQTDRGTITGTVTDTSGAVMVGVPVRTANVDTGFAYETVTSSTGNYTLPSLPVGNYEIIVETDGFNRFVRQGIRIQVAQTARIDLVLTVGSVTESIRQQVGGRVYLTDGHFQRRPAAIISRRSFDFCRRDAPFSRQRP